MGKGGIYSWCRREGYSECRTRGTGFTAGVAGGGLHNTARGCGGGVLLSRSAVGGATSDQWQLRVEDSGRRTAGSISSIPGSTSFQTGPEPSLAGGRTNWSSPVFKTMGSTFIKTIIKGHKIKDQQF